MPSTSNFHILKHIDLTEISFNLMNIVMAEYIEGEKKAQKTLEKCVHMLIYRNIEVLICGAKAATEMLSCFHSIVVLSLCRLPHSYDLCYSY